MPRWLESSPRLPPAKGTLKICKFPVPAAVVNEYEGALPLLASVGEIRWEGTRPRGARQVCLLELRTENKELGTEMVGPRGRF